MAFQLIYADSLELGNYKWKSIGGAIITGTRCDELVGISEEKLLESQLGIYPNPNSGSFHASVGERNIGYTFHIKNIWGESIYKRDIQAAEFDVFCQAFQPGIYFALVEGHDLQWSKKIIIR